jgi:hypothetical protein
MMFFYKARKHEQLLSLPIEIGAGAACLSPLQSGLHALREKGLILSIFLSSS